MTEDGTLLGVAHTGVPPQVDRDDCGLREVLDRVGDRWSVLVLSLLEDGPRRYSDLRRAIDEISQRMLTLTLRGLQRDGLVTRTVTPSTPPSVHYALTGPGRTLSTEVGALLHWARQHRDYIEEHRMRYDGALATHRGPG
ncbi:winged helix-turn-helix transcriptional regulator [Plantactinospora sp. GCM10030261]|uniref:winged helix-turn-helix transcriptional regulator n=1 Tax=Plantactinospora sp. GCM10030261 TaxID=3273420 RepID=UPI003614378A